MRSYLSRPNKVWIDDGEVCIISFYQLWKVVDCGINFPIPGKSYDSEMWQKMFSVKSYSQHSGYNITILWNKKLCVV